MRKLLLAVLLTASVYCSSQCTITTTTLPEGTVGTPYASAISGSCGTKASWNRLAGYPPLGLNISGSYGSIKGTPALAGLYYFQMQLKGTGGVAVQDYWISIFDPLTISTATQTSPWPCGQQVTASLFEAHGGAPPYKWSATGLPAGLTIDPDSGALRGTTPCKAAPGSNLPPLTYQIDITVTDSEFVPLVAKLEMRM